MLHSETYMNANNTKIRRLRKLGQGGYQTACTQASRHRPASAKAIDSTIYCYQELVELLMKSLLKHFNFLIYF